MCRVAKNDVDERTSAGVEPIRSTDASPRDLGNAVRECECARSLQPELVDEITDRTVIDLPLGHITSFVESSQRSAVVPTDSKQSVGKDAFGVEEVTDDFLDRPLAFGITKHRSRLSKTGTLASSSETCARR